MTDDERRAIRARNKAVLAARVRVDRPRRITGGPSDLSARRESIIPVHNPVYRAIRDARRMER